MSDSVGFSQDRYVFTKRLVDEVVQPGVAVMGRWKPPEVNLSDATEHVVSGNEIGQLDAIAYRYYGDEHLWALLAWVNNIENQLEEMEAGQILIVPSLSSIHAISRAWR